MEIVKLSLPYHPYQLHLNLVFQLQNADEIVGIIIRAWLT